MLTNMAVLVEPTATGFRATSLTIADLSAEAGTEHDALQAIRQQLCDRIGSSGKVVHLLMEDARFLQAWDGLRQSDWAEFDRVLREQRMKSDAQDLLEYGSDDGTI